MTKKSISFQTLCVSERKDNKSTDPHQLPIYATSSFKMESTDDAIDIFTGKTKGHVYGRYGNPTIDTVASKIADLESFGTEINAYCYLTSSGMSAISTLMYALAKSGDTILTQGNLYGGTTELFKKVMANHGVKSHFLNFDDLEDLKKAIESDRTIKFIYIETPANPTLAIVDLKALNALAKEFGLITIIDNTFCTPYIQQPLKFGIDFVIHSTTKFLNGHGNSIGGAIVGQRIDLQSNLFTTLKLLGATCNPWDAWLINNGLKTLALRMDKHCSNAMSLASKLVVLDGISKVNYNGLESNPYHELAKQQMNQFGGMISFEVEGNIESAKRFIDALEVCTHAPTLGDVDTLVLHPATSSHLNVDKDLRDQYGITDNLIRMSVGIESINDIYLDVANALQKHS